MATTKVMKTVVKAAKKKATKERARAAIATAKVEATPLEEAIAKKNAKDVKVEHSLVVTAAMKELAPIAKEINVKIELAAKMDSKAGDYRLSAALMLEEARKKCEAAKIPFKKWATENIPYSYENVRKLVAVGAAPEPAKALEDLRLKNAEANKRHRDAKKVEEPPKPAPDLKREEPKPAPVELPLPPATLEAMKEMFDKLKPMAKMAFLTWAAESIGATTEYTAKIKTDFDED
ncbi:MAG TPA: hypothetical protein DEP24_14020 [Mycobacterium sp.]|nr:hypothetical protein [Mycobacterium sp.]